MPFTAEPNGDVLVVKIHAKRLDAYLAPEFKARLVHLVVLGRNNPSLYTVNGRPLYVHLNGLAIVLLK